MGKPSLEETGKRERGDKAFVKCPYRKALTRLRPACGTGRANPFAAYRAPPLHHSGLGGPVGAPRGSCASGALALTANTPHLSLSVYLRERKTEEFLSYPNPHACCPSSSARTGLQGRCKSCRRDGRRSHLSPHPLLPSKFPA